MATLLIDILVLAGIGLILFAFLSYRRLKKPSANEKKEIAIEALSTIWNKHQAVKLSIDELVALWRDKAIVELAGEVQVAYKNPDIQEFYLNHISKKLVFSGNSGQVIIGILKLLDQEGNSPSVVNAKGEVEANLEKNSYDILSKVSLAKHSVNVAEEMMKMFKGKVVMYPKIVIAALGHDLGKLPSFREKMYSMGDHPVISITILEGIKGYQELPYKEEISKAIMEHHRNPKGVFSEALKTADQNSRRMEMSLYVKDEIQGKEDALYKESNSDKQELEALQAKTPKSEQQKIEAAESIFIEKNKEAKEKIRPTEIHLAWLNADEILKELKPYINKLSGSRWRALSMSNGYVFFQVSVIEDVIKKLGRRHNDSNVALMDTDRKLKTDIIFSVISFLRREKGAIAEGLIKNDFIGGKFKVKKKDGTEYEAYYTPFNLEVFGEQVSYFENLKVGVLNDIESVYISSES